MLTLAVLCALPMGGAAVCAASEPETVQDQPGNFSTATAALDGAVIALDTASISSSSTTSVTPVPTTAIFSGSVMAFDTKAGLENVDISIPFVGRSTRSGPGGAYQLVVPSGQYTVYYNPPADLAALYLPLVKTFDMPPGVVNGDVFLMRAPTPAIVTTTASSSTTTGPCPAQKVLGEDNPEIENLRDFRDSTVAQSAVGRRIIEIYYNNAGSINAALDRSPLLQSAARKALEAVSLLVQR